MKSRFRPKLTYANVMATIAVFIALGGSAYAATQLAKNSVGPKQLKANAVSGEKVKDGSLSPKDFTGVLGTPGAPGAPGEKGEKGDRGEPADMGLLDPATDLPGLGVLELSIDGHKSAVVKAYKIECNTTTTEAAHNA